ncbi:MAG: GDP-mannose 4,6-dehydratase [Chthoniobacteraceae bacterium]
MPHTPSPRPVALITGITGQDGSYLAELLLANGYEVHGLVRRAGRVQESALALLAANPEVLGKRLFFHYGDLADRCLWPAIFQEVQPDEVYHLGGQSHVGRSFEIPEPTAEEVAMASLRLLECLRESGSHARIYLAASSEIFGAATESPQTEETRFRPTSPYGCAKAFMLHMARVYRESYGVFVCNGILYNHESPRRGAAFVTRKITRAAAAIKLGLQAKLVLGNIESRRDWGHARDYVRAMWMMLRHSQPDDYIVATGVTRSVRDFVEAAFNEVGLPWRDYVECDSALERVLEPTQLVGNPAKIRSALGWTARHSFQDLVSEMVAADMQALARENSLNC